MPPKDDGLTPKTAPLSICPQCQTAMQHVMRGGKRVLECPNCRTNGKHGSTATAIKEPKKAEVPARKELTNAR